MPDLPATPLGTAASALASASPVSDATAGMQVSDRPWAAGVSSERQSAAMQHLQEGNGLLKESLFVEAAKIYRQALAEWDHPGIHYNLALALLNMDQPVEVYQHLERAIKFGADPLDSEKLEHAKSYLRLIERQVASLDVRCDVEGADVTLDGAPLFRGPGRYQGLVRAGTHTITASKSGFNTTSRTEALAYDKRTALNLKLYTAGELVEYRRPYPVWRPVAVAVLGGALLATGTVLTIEAQSRVHDYDNAAKQSCGITGCPTNDPNFAAINQRKDQAKTFQQIATISFVAGGAIAAAGMVLLGLDRSTAYRVDPDGERRQVMATVPSLAPLIGPGLAGIVGSGSF